MIVSLRDLSMTAVMLNCLFVAILAEGMVPFVYAKLLHSKAYPKTALKPRL